MPIFRAARTPSPDNEYSTGSVTPKRSSKTENDGWNSKQSQFLLGVLAVAAIALLVLGAISYGGHLTLTDIAKKAFTIAGSVATFLVAVTVIACCCRCCCQAASRGLDSAASSLSGRRGRRLPSTDD